MPPVPEWINNVSVLGGFLVTVALAAFVYLKNRGESTNKKIELKTEIDRLIDERAKVALKDAYDRIAALEGTQKSHGEKITKLMKLRSVLVEYVARGDLHLTAHEQELLDSTADDAESPN